MSSALPSSLRCPPLARSAWNLRRAHPDFQGGRPGTAGTRCPWRRAAAGIAIIVLASGCGKGARAEFGYDLRVPRGWTAIALDRTPELPGRTLEAYSVPAGPAGTGSLVVSRTEYRPNASAAQLLVETRNLLVTLSPTLRLLEDREIRVGDTPAILFSVVMEGDGRSLASTGLGKPVAPAGHALVPTRRLWVRVPRGPGLGTLEVFLHCPEESFAAIRSDWESLLASLRA